MPIVNIAWFEGKTHEQKAKVAEEVTASIVRHTGTEARYVYVVFNDVAPANWAGDGKLFGDPSPPSNRV